MFTVQMATAGVANQFSHHGLQIAQSIATYIISRGMSVFYVSVPRTNMGIISLLTSNTPGKITTYIEHSVMPTPRQPMPYSGRAIFMDDSICFHIFLVW
jgi:hypothetical protein